MRRQTRDRIFRMTAAGSVPFLIILSMALVASPSSANGLFIVSGIVRDQVGNPVEGVNVTVNIWNPGMTVINDTLYDDATDEDGFYTVTFGGIGGYEVKVNDVIEVIATYDTHFGTNTSTVASIPPIVYTVDASITTLTIPEFGLGQGIGLPVAILGILVVFAVVKRKRASV